MTLFSDRDERFGENLRILNAKFARKPKKLPVRGERPAFALGGSAPTIVIAASNSPASTMAKADYICTGTDDNLMFQLALQRMVDGEGGRLLVCEGDYYFSDEVRLFGDIRIEGMGLATKLHMASGSNASMFHLIVGGALPTARVSIAALEMDGHKALQSSGSHSGILVDANSNAWLTVADVYLHDFFGRGVFLDRAAVNFKMDRCVVSANTSHGLDLFVEGTFNMSDTTVSGNGGEGVRASGAALKMVGCRIIDNVSHGLNAGGIFESTAKVIVGNEFIGNGGWGIGWDAVNGHIVGNYVEDNTSGGILVFGNDPVSVVGNTVAGNTGVGIELQDGAGAQGGNCSVNTVKTNGQHGILVNGARWLVEGNRVDSNSQTTDNTYDGIHLTASADDCDILSNTIRQDASANQHRYSINVSAAGATNNWVAGNHGVGGNTGEYNDAGTGTINVWAGTFGDNY